MSLTSYRAAPPRANAGYLLLHRDLRKGPRGHLLHFFYKPAREGSAEHHVQAVEGAMGVIFAEKRVIPL